MSAPSRRVFSNAGASIVQVVVSALVFLVLYKILFDGLGADRLGVFSIVTALVSIARIGELGLAGSVVKFVAKHEALGERAEVARVTATAMVAVALCLGVALIAAYPLFRWVMPLLLPAPVCLRP